MKRMINAKRPIGLFDDLVLELWHAARYLIEELAVSNAEETVKEDITSNVMKVVSTLMREILSKFPRDMEDYTGTLIENGRERKYTLHHMNFEESLADIETKYLARQGNKL